MANKNAIPPDKGFKAHPERINKKGRPKKLDIKEAVQIALSEEKNGLNGLEAMIKKVMQAAINKGDIRAVEFLARYGFGTPNPMPSDTEESKKEIGLNITLTMPDEAPRKAD
jgi:hypothetical protein